MKKYQFFNQALTLEKHIDAESSQEAVVQFIDIIFGTKLSTFQEKDLIDHLKRNPELMSYFNFDEVLP